MCPEPSQPIVGQLNGRNVDNDVEEKEKEKEKVRMRVCQKYYTII